MTQSLSANAVSPLTKSEIRSSLKASTCDGIFATLFNNVAGGVLLSNFLLQWGANAVEIGMLASTPLVVNSLQPLGAYFADRMRSRRNYSFLIFIPARLLWLLLVVAIALTHHYHFPEHRLVEFTLALLWLTQILESLGRASWLSWISTLVPAKLRGRYFGFRNSAVSLVNLIAVPCLGLMIAAFPNSYSIALILGVIVGLISIICQRWMKDINPQNLALDETVNLSEENEKISFSLLQNRNFLKFLLYFGGWSLAVNMSAPFFNLYLLDNLHISVSLVALYTSFGAGANLLMLMIWGKLADRIGNRPLLLSVGILVALTPLLWLGTGTDAISLWLVFPLLHILAGGTWAAIDLCTNNLQIEVASVQKQSSYFALVAAVGGVCGAMGITFGSFLATFSEFGGLPSVFIFSALLRFITLFPLLSVEEKRSLPLRRFFAAIFPLRRRVRVQAG